MFKKDTMILNKCEIAQIVYDKENLWTESLLKITNLVHAHVTRQPLTMMAGKKFYWARYCTWTDNLSVTGLKTFFVTI